MSAYDVDRAIARLAAQLGAWGVVDTQTKARDFITDMVAAGWQMSPDRQNRPFPPRSHEACPDHPGEHRDRCRLHAADRVASDGPTMPTPSDTRPASEQVAKLKNLAAPKGLWDGREASA